MSKPLFVQVQTPVNVINFFAEICFEFTLNIYVYRKLCFSRLHHVLNIYLFCFKCACIILLCRP